MAIFNIALKNASLSQMRDLYAENKDTLARVCQIEMMVKLINFCLKSGLLSEAFSFIPAVIQLKMKTSQIINELFNKCAKLPPVHRKRREQFIGYLVDMKYKIDGNSLKRVLDELLKKNEAVSLWKLLKYSCNLIDYRPSIKLCDWAIQQLNDKEEELDVVLAHFYLLKEDVRKVSPNSIEKLRTLTKKDGGIVDTRFQYFLQMHKYSASPRPTEKKNTVISNSPDEVRRNLWHKFATVELNEQLLNDLLTNFYEQFSEIQQTFSAFYNFVKTFSATTELDRSIAKLAFIIVMECSTRQEFQLGHSIINVLFSDGKNHFELLETNFVVSFQMALACLEICVKVNDELFALEVLKATDGAMPGENNNDRNQRLLRLQLLHSLFKKYDEDDPALYNNQILLFECMIRSNDRDSVMLTYCNEASYDVAFVYEKLMYRFIQHNVFELAFRVYERGTRFQLNEDCCRGYLVLLRRNEYHALVSRKNFTDLLRVCQNKGFYPRFAGFDRACWEILIRSYYTVEEILVLLEIYFENLANFLRAARQKTCQTIFIVVQQRPFRTCLSILTAAANRLKIEDRVSEALKILNLSLVLDSNGFCNEPILKIEAKSLQCFIDERIKEGPNLKFGNN